jgi:hypothetical protein
VAVFQEILGCFNLDSLLYTTQHHTIFTHPAIPHAHALFAAQTTIAESPEEYFTKKFGSFTIFFISLLIGNDNFK